ncbi:MAG TPA: cohesin domain-containing protein [Luteolibacter sp.]|nr:cohesin domain-containing protein [Luteolibacter sp.]
MNDILHRISCAALLAGVLLAPCTASAETRHLSLPGYLANPGQVLHVPLTLDNAAGLAAIRVQINFDPEVLELQAVTAGPLGEAFEMSRGDGDGFVQLTFARGVELASGSGRLAVLKFLANPGAVTSLYSELAIADFNPSDATGVIDLRQKDTLAITNGQVAVTLQPNIDNAGNGLPDWWEELHELDVFADHADLDAEHDGLTNLLEYAFGGNPKVADASERGVRSQPVEADGQTFLSIGFYRRLGDASLLYRVQESPDLGAWINLALPERILGTPQDMGDGTEYVNVLGTLPMDGPDPESRGFMRVGVEKAD